MIKISLKKIINKFLQDFGYQLIRTAVLPRDAFELQRDLIKTEKPTILDIGAHVGAVTKIYRELFPQASIHCFEPFSQSFQSLSKNLKGDPLAFCYETAVCEKDGTASLNANRNSQTNSLLKTDERASLFWGEGVLETSQQFEVNTITLDTFCFEKGISHVDILKLDTQGAEFSAILGAKEILANQRISLIYTELIICPTYERQHKLHEYLSCLDSFGYGFFDLFNPVRNHGQLIQADALFVSSSFKKRLEVLL
jgi:FkbM family methyltransferase